MQKTIRSSLTVLVALLVEMTVTTTAHSNLIGLIAGVVSLVAVWVVVGLVERK